VNQLSDLLFRGTKERNSLRDVSDGLLLELDSQAKRRDRYVRYAVLLSLSTVIATGGVVTDSTATVIGAMIVAPLATPILGLAFALVVASPRRLRHSVALLALSVVAVIGLAVALAWVMPDVVDFAHNSQVLGRTSPRVTDLMVAIATGFVGAYAVVRKDLSSVMPGVAIAISLVPPLAVVGLSIHHREWDDALGAFVLFSSNVVAMVLAGISMFWVAGFRPRDLPSRATSLRRAYSAVAVMLAILLVPLGVSTVQSVQTYRASQALNAAVPDWLSGSGYEFQAVRRAGDAVVVVVVGSGTLPDTEQLVSDLEGSMPAGSRLVIEVVPGESRDVGTF